VNAFEVILPESNVELPKEQHGEYRWFTEDELLASVEVHDHSKWYFDKTKGYI
jgi:colanic acid biosynthesis protein WcaH